MTELSITKQDVIQRFVRSRTVHDLGAGNLEQASMLVRMGAFHVHAIDRDPMPDPGTARIARHVCHFDEWQHEGFIDVAFLSWPANWDTGVLRLLRQSKTIIYHGKCTDGTMCGYPEMWHHLVNREVWAHVHDRSGVLIVYGDQAQVRNALPEELCGMDLVQQHSYDSVYGA